MAIIRKVRDLNKNELNAYLLSIGVPVETNIAYDIFLVAGQSNCYYGDNIDPILDAPNDDIKQWGRYGINNNQIIEAIDPLEFYTQQTNRISFSMTFAKQYLSIINPNRKVLLVPAAEGGAGFSNNRWNKGDDLYEDAVTRVNTILGLNVNNEFKGILWAGGEADLGSSTAVFKGLLENFVNNIRLDITGDNSQVPITFNDFAPEWLALSATPRLLTEGLKQAANDLSYARFVETELPTPVSSNGVSDRIHISGDGHRAMGQRVFDAYQLAVNDTPPPTPQVDITSGKILELLFDTDFSDTSGNGVVVTPTNISLINDVDLGSSIESAASTSKIDVPFFLPTSWTKYAYFKYNTAGTGNIISSASNDNTLLWINGGTLRAGQTGNFTRLESQPLVVGNTYKVAITYDAVSQNFNMYLNGVLETSAVNVPPITGDPLVQIGAWKNTSPFLDPIGDVIIYDRALNQVSGETLTAI